MNILITAFEPFGTDTKNSSQELLKVLPEIIDGKKITKLILPVVFDVCAETIKSQIKNSKPDTIICLGQTGFDESLCVEKVAINYKHARIADNDGNTPYDIPIIANGETAYFSTLPILDMVESSNKAGVKARISYSAGAYVCNNLMYHVLEMTEKLDTKACFIHIPSLPSQGTESRPTMTTEDASKGIEAMISAL
jgi:pyroglutamyl-peptidase